MHLYNAPSSIIVKYQKCGSSSLYTAQAGISFAAAETPASVYQAPSVFLHIIYMPEPQLLPTIANIESHLNEDISPAQLAVMPV